MTQNNTYSGIGVAFCYISFFVFKAFASLPDGFCYMR